MIVSPEENLGHSRDAHNKSLDRSHGNPDSSGIKRDPAKLLVSAVALGNSDVMRLRL